jgi:hypothetical protein
MNLTFKHAVINKETDFVENGIDKINVDITIVCDLIGTNNVQEIALPFVVINLNSQTGEEMDIDRMIAINDYVNNF